MNRRELMEDGHRDAVALIRAVRDSDQDGIEVIIGNSASLGTLACQLAVMYVREMGDALTDEWFEEYQARLRDGDE